MRHRDGASVFGAGLAAMGICCATTTLVAAGLGAVAVGLFVVGPLAAVVFGIILIAVIQRRRDREATSADPPDSEPSDVVGRR